MLLERSGALGKVWRELASRSTELIALSREAVDRAKNLSDEIRPPQRGVERKIQSAVQTLIKLRNHPPGAE